MTCAVNVNRSLGDCGLSILVCRDRTIGTGNRTCVMGILNVTPDSFSDGGRHNVAADAIMYACRMVAEGADIIDVGGESSRPGAAPVPVEEELRRVIPVVEGLVEVLDVPISIDTTKSEVARATLDAGAHMINDISGLRFDPEMARVVADYGAAVVIMHMQGTPRDMQVNPTYDDVMQDIIAFMRSQVDRAQAEGISYNRIVVDPGIGFGKTTAHNLEILRRLNELKVLDLPVLVGTSRKSLTGDVLGLPVSERLEGTAATVAVSIMNGASIIRVHDVKAMKRVAVMTDAVLNLSP